MWVTLRPTVMAATLTLAPALALAQEARSFEQVANVIASDERVLVTDIGGGDVRGHVVEVLPSSITLRFRDDRGIERTRTFERGTVSQIRRTDRLWNGLFIGLAAGFAASEMWVYNVCGPRGYDSECSAIATAVGWVTFVPGGAVAGALIDKVIGNQLIYRGSAASAVSVYISPTFSVTQAGIAGTIRF